MVEKLKVVPQIGNFNVTHWANLKPDEFKKRFDAKFSGNADEWHVKLKKAAGIWKEPKKKTTKSNETID